MDLAERYSLIRQRFDRRAIQYQRNPLTHWVGHSEMAALRRMIPPPPRRGELPALDFGCGTGRVTILLLELGYRVTGYDLSPGMLDQARAAIGERLDVIFTSDPQSLGGSWPLIVALGVLDYYPDCSLLFQEWRRLLCPGGTLIVTIPNARSPLARLYAFFSRFTCQAYVNTLAELTSAAQSAGFTLTGTQVAFPRRWWGHTIVTVFQLQTP
ncbi:MAG: class I SAM-dependent methyltransferase [Chloroflexi bacterium]|nr:class I SAM-dependent methyltransferase [Chloroflexota bacterium]